MGTGLLFSGQGAQFVGMGRTLCQNSELVDDIYTRVNRNRINLQGVVVYLLSVLRRIGTLSSCPVIEESN